MSAFTTYLSPTNHLHLNFHLHLCLHNFTSIFISTPTLHPTHSFTFTSTTTSTLTFNLQPPPPPPPATPHRHHLPPVVNPPQPLPPPPFALLLHPHQHLHLRLRQTRQLDGHAQYSPGASRLRQLRAPRTRSCRGNRSLVNIINCTPISNDPPPPTLPHHSPQSQQLDTRTLSNAVLSADI